MNPMTPMNPKYPTHPTHPTPPPILLPHSGYRKLIAYKKSAVIYQGTVVFCRRFLDARRDRTVDQMVQAARSCKQNIAEGSAAAATSLETQLKLTGVAKASLDELLEDVRDWLKANGKEEWSGGRLRWEGRASARPWWTNGGTMERSGKEVVFSFVQSG